VGVRATCASFGIWALTLQELLLGMGRLRTGGTFLFRFGWRGRGLNEEAWYREATVLLLALVCAHFAAVATFKSEFSHQADSTFYVVASGFQREDYESAGLCAVLRSAVDSIIACRRTQDLPKCLEALARYATMDRQQRVDELLEAVSRLRAIGVASRQHVEAGGRPNPAAALWISPVPFHLTLQRIRDRLQHFGKISNIRRRAHPVGVGADAMVQFSQPAHAAAALQAIQELGVLGENVVAHRLCDVS